MPLTSGHQPVFQKHLEHVVRTLFEGENILVNVRKEANINKPNSDIFLELDVWIPDLQLCFEFQDDYHYVPTWYSHKTLDFVQFKDKSKQEIAKAKGLTFISVPFWWNGSDDSLSQTIVFARPDMLERLKPFLECPIQLNPDENIFSGSLPGVGELMLASFPSSSRTVHSINCKNSWWLGEKHDGIRACWNPVTKILYTRTGNLLEIPLSFATVIPKLFVDCEIWSGRGMFHEALSLVRSEAIGDWTYLRFVAFDRPDFAAHEYPFEERYAHLISQVPFAHPFLIIAMRMRCASPSVLQHFTTSVIHESGEGLILRQPLSRYEPGRSLSLWKIKAAREDTEALVMRAEISKPLLLKLPNSTTFLVPHSALGQELFGTRLKKGDVVTVSFENYSRKSIPVNPKITRIREDVTWQHVLHEFVKQRQSIKRDTLSFGYIKNPKFEDRKTKMRNFLERFAASQNLDPLLPSSWYSLSVHFTKLKGAYAILKYFKNSLAKAVISLFPKIGAQESKFKILTAPRQHWVDIGNRRVFFTKFANKKKFDPLVAKNWYKVTTESVLAVKGGSSVLRNYDGKLESALVHLFPDIGLVEGKFKESIGVNWHKIAARRKLFENFAKQRGFEALNPLPWYLLGAPGSESKDMETLLSTFYGGNLPTALQHLFPEVNFVEEKFTTLPEGYWNAKENQRKVFVNFAKENQFDALIPQNWYRINPDAIREYSGAGKILEKYGGSIIQALISIFPDIELDRKPLSSSIYNYYIDYNNQKQLLVNFAEKKGFDPLLAENWYSVPAPELLEKKEAVRMFSFYHGSAVKAIIHAFPNIGLQRNKFKELT